MTVSVFHIECGVIELSKREKKQSTVHPTEQEADERASNPQLETVIHFAVLILEVVQQLRGLEEDVTNVVQKERYHCVPVKSKPETE